MPWHDLLCERGHRASDVMVRGEPPPCGRCGGPCRIVFDRWTTVHTDLYPTPRYSDASGRWHSSQREKERYMRTKGFDAAGDPVGGARAEHRIRDAAFSYAGQGDRTSTSERRRRSGRIRPGVRAARRSA